ncbi:MAG: tetraacyldisaccharide 4'-kinase [Rickettsiales bacterium]|nr:tetraacyldisaccharide 4'-kinase [Rickettsiales bacterium]
MLKFQSNFNIFSILLWPLTLIYILVVRFRQIIFKPNPLPGFSIIVGNATMGGGGKTPSAIAIGKILQELANDYYYFTKGYKGSILGPEIVNLDKHTVEQTGDESRVLASHAQTIIAKQRHKANDYLNKFNDKIIVLDDGFQNVHLKVNLKILVIDENFLFGNNMLLPAGPLRDSLAWHFKEADCLFFIGGSDSEFKLKYRKYIANTPLFKAKPALIDDIDKNKSYLAFSGLANNSKFQNFLRKNNIKIAEFQAFPDHHKYTKKDLLSIKKFAESKGVDILTTEKDAVKIDSNILTNYSICKMQLEFEDKIGLAKFLKMKIKS